MTITWITGVTGCGKTALLTEKFAAWVAAIQSSSNGQPQNLLPGSLILAANDDNRRVLGDRLVEAVAGRYPVLVKTPLGFIADEVTLFWPLIFEKLALPARFPLRLRSETEQRWATQLWSPQLDRLAVSNPERIVRRVLDLLQLAGAAGIEREQIPDRMTAGWSAGSWQGFSGQWLTAEGSGGSELIEISAQVGDWLERWWQWCLNRGLLSYGIMYSLYWRYLLPNPRYQGHLTRRFSGVFADDVDDFPASARSLFETLLATDCHGVLTFNPEGKIRLGLGADPDFLWGLTEQITPSGDISELQQPGGLASQVAESALALLTESSFSWDTLPPVIQELGTISRAELLRRVAETIVGAVQGDQVEPQDIAIIAPGLDDIGRYTLTRILVGQGIPVAAINEQRPLMAVPAVRSLLTLLALIYPGLGRWVQRDAIAEMLVLLSDLGGTGSESVIAAIDPVRAGILADHCFYVDQAQPRLLPAKAYARWDRLGERAVTAYERICTWITDAQAQIEQKIWVTPIHTLHEASRDFFYGLSNLRDEQMSALRALAETLAHFWEVERRCQSVEQEAFPHPEMLATFMDLLKAGTISANPYPASPLLGPPTAVTLATIFQYRSQRRSHRWQFWLDASSPLWLKGGAATLFGAPWFERLGSGGVWTPDDQMIADTERLERIVRNLLGHATERVVLCHSELGINGTEQIGPLSPLIQACQNVADAIPAVAEIPF
ncbi:MAG: recombinase family protein [Cyanobacteria bacterium P01_H01_bin.15]